MCFIEGSRHPTSNPDHDSDHPTTSGEEELQLQLALALSKEEHDEQMKRQKADDLKLQMAIEESKKTAKTSFDGTRSQVFDPFRLLIEYRNGEFLYW